MVPTQIFDFVRYVELLLCVSVWELVGLAKCNAIQ